MTGLLMTVTTGLYWVWGQVVPYYPGPDSIYQAFVCKSDNALQGDPYIAKDCLLIGPPTHDLQACYRPNIEMARVDFPDHKIRFCTPVRLQDLERLSIPSK